MTYYSNNSRMLMLSIDPMELSWFKYYAWMESNKHSLFQHRMLFSAIS